VHALHAVATGVVTSSLTKREFGEAGRGDRRFGGRDLTLGGGQSSADRSGGAVFTIMTWNIENFFAPAPGDRRSAFPEDED
jgi:hypothetical protein